MNIGLRVFASLFAVVGLAGPAAAGSIVVNFDSVSVAAGQCADSSSYLSGFGIGFVGITNSTIPTICNATGSVLTPFSPPNFFVSNALVTNAPLSYELTFSQPLTSFSFVRIAESSSSTSPPYTITALDALGQVLSSVSEPFKFGSPAVTFTLSGPGIVAIRVDANNSVASTLNEPPLDNFTLVTSVPEPSSMIFCCLSLSVFLAVFNLRRRAISG